LHLAQDLIKAGNTVHHVLRQSRISAQDPALAHAISALKQLGTTFVVMTHRTSVLGVADKMLIMRDGAQQACGPREAVLAALQQKAKS
jgi:ATP-binding cassette subfamily C exporter for protease/lipase